MSDRIHRLEAPSAKPPSQSDAAEIGAPAGPLDDRMKHVREAREAASAQIARSMRVWRKVSGTSGALELGRVYRSPRWRGDDSGDEDGGRERGPKGETFRGGRKKDRDQWYGLETKPDFAGFKQWWHRIGKDEMGGKDLMSREEAEQAYQTFQSDSHRAK